MFSYGQHLYTGAISAFWLLDLLPLGGCQYIYGSRQLAIWSLQGYVFLLSYTQISVWQSNNISRCRLCHDTTVTVGNILPLQSLPCGKIPLRLKRGISVEIYRGLDFPERLLRSPSSITSHSGSVLITHQAYCSRLILVFCKWKLGHQPVCCTHTLIQLCAYCHKLVY